VLKYQGKYFVISVPGALVLACMAIIASACGFTDIVDLRPVSMTSDPYAENTVLAGRMTGISIAFSTEPEQMEVERIFSVQSSKGVLEGDFTWEGSSFIWTPVSPWDPGVRYRLMVRGAVRMLDGREIRPEMDLPFYAVRSSGLPVLVSWFPADGATVGVTGSMSTMLELSFSEPMDQRSVELAFGLVPKISVDYSWNDDGMVLSIIPRNRLDPCTVYHWKVSAEARALDGAPLANEKKGTLSTDSSIAGPVIERVYPVAFVGDLWVEMGEDLSTLEAEHSIAVKFSEPVDSEKAESGVRIEHGQSGNARLVRPDLVVYTPEDSWVPEKSYTLLVSADVENQIGISMIADCRIEFITRTPFLEVLTISASEGQLLLKPDNKDTILVTVWNEPEGILTLTLEFSAPFNPVDRSETTNLVSLDAFFPNTLAVPVLKSVAWPSGDSLVMTWQNLKKSNSEVTNFYELTMPGGQAGLKSAGGLYMSDDFSVFVEAME